MSSLADIRLPNYPAHLLFPSPSSDDRLLCLNPYNRHDGSKNSYALAYPNALPHNSTLLRGLTIVSDTLYRTENIWHGLSTIVPFVGWYQRNKCVNADRWVYFHHGQLRSKMANWVNALTEATTGDEVRIEDFEGYGGGAVCFEKAIVFRHLEQGLEREGRERVYDMMRCRAREYCGVKVNGGRIGVTLLLRVGGRAFKNESAVIGVFERGCAKVDGCAMKVAWSDNLTFCDQVSLLSETDILVTSHGAQMTNMIFMDKNSSVMEFFPKGWLEYAGVGQYVYRWLAAWSGMRHQGQWKEPLEGENCPHNDNFKCFAFYKDGKVGHDEAYFATFMARVLDEVKASKNATKQESKGSAACQYCGS
ncbi:uncharacterized protein LOC109834559 [Asparagus officinalis]|uniref:uncharacterized protein LOC109834559 n=1 Tax=Asparagus officinalis TaxID=4686 RepID=UPI00098E2512|nr:uncharacterized protein LOC109834559 [Asparagus officinalis]